MTDREWRVIARWRRRRRADLLARRLALPRQEKATARAAVAAGLARLFEPRDAGWVGLYWPFRGEVDLLRAIGDAGAAMALPVVVRRGAPLEFRLWRPGMAMQRGVWDIPVPAERTVVRPSVLLVPLLGFDAAGYRLGYGGGYYDRTLAAMEPRPLAIGVGYEALRLPTIHPQPHDIPMDAIVTDAGIRRFGDGSGAIERPRAAALMEG